MILPVRGVLSDHIWNRSESGIQRIEFEPALQLRPYGRVPIRPGPGLDAPLTQDCLNVG